MRRTIASMLAALFVAATLAPADAWAQNASAPTTPPTAQATPSGAAAAMPAKSSAKRYTTMRGGKFRNRRYRHTNWRTAASGGRATNAGATTRPNHWATHNARTGTASKSGIPFVGSNAAMGTHHKAVAGKGKATTGIKHDAPKSSGAKT